MSGSPITDDSEAEHPAWKRLKEMHDRGDFDKIDEMVQTWDGILALKTAGALVIKVLGWVAVFGRFMVKFLGWMAALFAVYGTLTGQLRNWLRGVVG